MNSQQLFYQIASTLIPNVGPINTKKLLALFGNAETIFTCGKKELLLKKISQQLIEKIQDKKILLAAEKELMFVEKHKIDVKFYLNDDYPFRLRQCDDGPVLIYQKGKLNYNTTKVLSIVGSRKTTKEGIKNCECLIEELNDYSVQIVSGLAYGIDICAHKTALKNKLPTIAVLAHGLDRIYPNEHRATAIKMMENGGVLTDFTSSSSFHPGNFPARNRIVAGMSDATIVIESGLKGGSLITAHMANDYNRDVFAFPGRITDQYSKGCNKLIKENSAALMESASDLISFLGWECNNEKKKHKPNLSQGEKTLYALFTENNSLHIDCINRLSGLPASDTASLLLGMEFKGVIQAMAGKKYRLIL